MRSIRTRLSFESLEEVLYLVSAGGITDAAAYVCRRTGEIHLQAPEVDLDEVPEDADDPALYAVVPDKRDLDLERTMVLDFAAQEVPDLLDRIAAIFRSPGAYQHLKDLLRQEGKLERWYDYEAERTERALRSWCEMEGFELLKDGPTSAK